MALNSVLGLLILCLVKSSSLLGCTLPKSELLLSVWYLKGRNNSSGEKCFQASMVLGRFCGRAIVYNVKCWPESWQCMFYPPGNLQLHASVNQFCVRVCQDHIGSVTVSTAFVYFMEDSRSVVASSNFIIEALSAVFNVI